MLDIGGKHTKRFRRLVILRNIKSSSFNLFYYILISNLNIFYCQLGGASYMDIHKAGGGIHFTVDHTRKASPEYLQDLLEKRLKRMSKSGNLVLQYYVKASQNKIIFRLRFTFKKNCIFFQ